MGFTQWHLCQPLTTNVLQEMPSMKTRDELNEMTKQEIIDLVCNNELLHRVNSLRAINFAAVRFVEQVGRELADRDHAFSRIIHARFDGAGDLEIIIPQS
jgi:hypothetical protein